MSFDRDEIQQRIAAGGPVDLSGRDLSGADLTRLDLRRADLSRADLTGADLRWAVLEGANLRASVLRRADARWSILKHANLAQADLGGANLGWADVTGADLTDAVLDGASLENVDLASVFVARAPSRRAGGRRGGRPGVLAGLRLPSALAGRVSPAVLAAAAAGIVALLHLWGWLFRRAYLLGDGGFGLDADLVGIGQGANLVTGLTRVLGLELEVLVAAPLALLALLVVAALALAVPALAYLVALRALSDVHRPAARMAVIGGLFLSFSIAFFLLVPEAVRAAGLVGHALPSGPRLGAVLEHFRMGGWLVKLGGLVLLALAALPGWAGLRWLAHRAAGAEVPVRWRLRYPGLNRLHLALREPRLRAATAALTVDERRRGQLGLAALLALLGFWLTGVGRVYAQRDMCDGGSLPRAQLYALPADVDPEDADIDPTLDLRDVCGRIVLQTDSALHVFFPSETGTERDTGLRRAQVYAVDRRDVGLIDAATGESACPTCADGPSGLEQALIDPDEARVAGIVDGTYETGSPIVALEAEGFEGPTPMIRMTAGETRILAGGRRAGADAIQPGRRVVAYGRVAGEADGAYLDAREVRVLLPGEAEPGAGGEDEPGAPAVPAGPAAAIQVDLSNPAAPRISGSGFEPGVPLQVAVADRAADPLSDFVTPLTTVSAGPDGTFDAPIAFNPAWPTGPELVLVVRDPSARRAATGAWLVAPPPTPTPRPAAVPTVISEDTPTPEGGEPTEEPLGEATNTPFPTLSNVPGGGRGASAGCEDPDEFEFDDGLGFEKELPISFGEGAPQTHNFCSAFDIDLVWFPVKAGRHYRVATSNLAPGVDTVMALGNLPAGTPCQPFHPTWGCWSDDKSALTFESEITFTATGDGKAIITLDNRGSAAGGDAAYDVSVVQFEPEPTTTPTPAATNTPKPSPTATKTPLPFQDVCDRPGSLDGCRYACVLTFDQAYEGVINPGTDVDWFQIDLDPGQYEVTLDVPEDQNYDIELFFKTSATVCETTGARSANTGDRDERIPFGVLSRQTIAFRVDTYYTTVFGDPFDPYVIKVTYAATPTPGGPTWTPIVPPSSTPTPSITPSPTATPTLPVAIPPTWTPGPPTATPTPTETPAATPSVVGAGAGSGR